MKKCYVVTAVVIALVAFLSGYYLRSGGKGDSAGGRTVLYYVDPMHPAYRSEKPGIAPDCGMQLEPVYADGGPPGGGGVPLPPGAIRITPERQQLIGVRTAVVEQAPVTHQVRVLGRVAPDETRVYRINSSLAGFVQSVSTVTTGSFVKRDQYLASIYSPDLYALINSYIFALNSIDRQEKLTPENIKRFRQDISIRGNRNSLLNIGMSETQLDEILKTRYNKEVIDIRSTESGYVLQRNISLGERFERGVEFYRIADLSKVWILADIFENEASYFKPGVLCQAKLPHRNLTFSARVGSVLPLYDSATRTLKVRLEVDNAGLVLRPDMFVDVELPVTLPAMITLPREALLDTGLKQTVFVDRGNGIFEPRAVEAGRYFGDRVEIVKGLVPGERIAVSGNFLLDSETRLKNSSSGIAGTPGKDPVCGMALDQETAKAAALTRQYGGKSWYFCSPEDMAKFDRAPKRYTGPGAAAESTTGHPVGGAAGAMKMPMETMPLPSAGVMTRKQKGALPAGMGRVSSSPSVHDAGISRRNFPTPLDDPNEAGRPGAMVEEAPPPPPVAPAGPGMNRLMLMAPKASPATAPSGNEAVAPNPKKVPAPHD